MKKKVLIGIPERLLEHVNLLAEYRSQTRSELIREALRNHLERAESGGVSINSCRLPVLAGHPQD